MEQLITNRKGSVSAMTSDDNSGEPNSHGKTPWNGSRQKAPGVMLSMQKDIYRHAYDRGMTSGALSPHGGDEEALKEHARAMAREAHRDAFDTTKHSHDEMLDCEYRKNLTDRADVEQAAKFAEADVTQREEEVAQSYPGPEPSKPSITFVAAAVVGTMLTVAPSAHDFIFVMSDEAIAWVLSLVCGLFLGLLIALMILGDADSAGHRTITNWMGLSAGIFVSLALGAIRIGAARRVGDIVFAAGMSLLEIAIVLALEAVAARRRAAMTEWSVRNSGAQKAKAALGAAWKKLDRWKDRLRTLNELIDSHIGYVEERAVRNVHIEELETAALKAATDGYLAGIADNRGRVLGVGRKGKHE
jgi:hypothetical protein